jgi:hypothetical protein
MNPSYECLPGMGSVHLKEVHLKEVWLNDHIASRSIVFEYKCTLTKFNVHVLKSNFDHAFSLLVNAGGREYSPE